MDTTIINEAIAMAMGDSKVMRYVVKAASGELVMAFMDGNVETREKAEAWIKEVKETTCSKTDGWWVDSQLAWPDYLNSTSHASRFINWGLRRARHELTNFESLPADYNVQNLLAGSLIQSGVLVVPSPTICQDSRRKKAGKP